MGKQIDPITQFILACQQIKGIGGQTIKKYVEKIDDAQAVIDNFNLLNKIADKRLKNKISDGTVNENNWRAYTDNAFAQWEKAKAKNIEIISYKNKFYPKNLLSLPKCPIIFYAKGNVELLNTEKSVAIIGTRNPTDFGKRIGGFVAEQYADKGYVIVSGLAKGCDTVAHEAAMRTTKRTIAILAAGLDQPVYPKQNKDLAERIIENDDGLLLSTYPLGEKLRPQYLAARDEWQSGMSDGVIAIQTGLKGGTNIAINHSFEQDRPLAVIDYSLYFNKETNESLDNLPQALGNKRYLDDGKAFGLYYGGQGSDKVETIDEFAHMMQSKHEERMNKLKEILTKKVVKEDKNNIKQLGFDF